MRTPNESTTAASISRWRTARSVVLGSIILAGSMATSAALMYRLAGPTCAQRQEVERGYTYSGIGTVIQQHGGEVVVRQVMAGGPADGLLRPGAVLEAVDGETPRNLEAWANALRGPAGTVVSVEVSYPYGGHETLQLERQVIRVHR
ncbi:MAG: PDZ domain-containing protein [Nannocystaceae bacterium]